MKPLSRGLVLLLGIFTLFSCGRNSMQSELVLEAESNQYVRTISLTGNSNPLFVFTNRGTQDPTNLKITLPSAPFIPLRQDCGNSLDPEFKYFVCKVSFEIKPSARGTYTDRLIIEYNNNGTQGTNASVTVFITITVT